MALNKKVKSSKKDQYNFNKISVLAIILLLVVTVVVLYFLTVKPRKNQGVDNFTDFNESNTYADAGEYYNPDREVLVVFCKMSGCGHCVNFNKNVWEKVIDDLEGATTKVGKKLKLMVADVTHPLASDVTGFPTIKKYGANPADYTEFEQARTIDNFTIFCLN